jgi:hypothetical protein
MITTRDINIRMIVAVAAHLGEGRPDHQTGHPTLFPGHQDRGSQARLPLLIERLREIAEMTD